MKRYPYFPILIPCGALLGLLSAAYLVDFIFLPTFQCFLPLEMAKDAAALASLKAVLRVCTTPCLFAAGILSVWSWLAMVKQLNPRFPLLPVRRHHPYKGRAWAAFLLPLVLAGGLWLVFDYFWKGMDLWIYNVPSPSFNAKSFLVYAVVVFTLVWVIVSPDGLAGPFLTKEESSPSPYPLPSRERGKIKTANNQNPLPLRERARARGESAFEDFKMKLYKYLRCALRGALYGVVFACILFYSIQLRDFLFNVNTEVFHRMSGPSLPQALSLLASFGLQGLLVFTAAFGLAPAFSDKTTLMGDNRWKKAVFPLSIILALLVLHGFMYFQAAGKSDWKKAGLAEAAGLSLKPVPENTCFYWDGDSKPLTEAWPMEAGDFPASAENATRLTDFLLKPGNQSRYLEQASLTSPEMDWRLWEPARAQEWIGRFLDPQFPSSCRPSVESLQALVLWLDYSSPLTEENRQLLSLLCDPQRFQIPPAAARDFASAWIRFGDAEKARYWEEQARLGGRPLDQARLEQLSSMGQENVTAWAGTIQGKISLRGFPKNQPLKAALFCIFKNDTPRQNNSVYLPSLSHMTDAQWVKTDGSFRFDHLSQGTYRLAFLVSRDALKTTDPKPDSKAKSSPSLGLLTLSPVRPRINTGTLVIP